GAGKVANISATLAGTGGFNNNGTGTLVLSGSNSVSGPVLINGNSNILTLGNGGILNNVTTLTVNVASSSGTNQFILDGGILTSSSLTTINGSSATKQALILIKTGTANFNGGVTVGPTQIGATLKITGGTVN